MLTKLVFKLWIVVFWGGLVFLPQAIAQTLTEQEQKAKTQREFKALYMPAYTAYRKGQYPKALNGYTSSLDFTAREYGFRSRQYYMVAKELARVYEDLAQAKKAEAVLVTLYDRTIGAHPEEYGPLEVKPMKLLAKFYLRQDDFVRAEKYYREVYDPKVGEVGEDYRLALREMCALEKNLGSIYEASNNWQAAQDVFEACLGFVPEDKRTPLRSEYQRLASATFMMGAQQKAIAMLETSVAAYKVQDRDITSRDQAAARLRLAEMYINAGQFDKGFAQVGAVNQRPNDYGANEFVEFNKGWAVSARGLVKAGDFTKALELLDRIAPNFERIYTPLSLEVAALYDTQVAALHGAMADAQPSEKKVVYAQQAAELTAKARAIRAMTDAERKVAVLCYRSPKACAETDAGRELFRP